MLKELKQLLYLFSLVILTNCTNNDDIILIMGESVITNKNYPPDCYIKNNGKELQINQAFLYHNNNLIKYVTPQAEGLVIEKINNESHSKEYEHFKKLNLKILENNTVELFNKKYTIERQNEDTIYLDKDKIIIIKNPTTF